MMAALPTAKGVKPLRARKYWYLVRLLVSCTPRFRWRRRPWKRWVTRGSLVHGGQLNAADINTANLKQYDAIFLDSTTGCFLDDPKDKAASDARRAAFLDFVRNGKGIAGIHAATDSYHSDCTSTGGGGVAVLLCNSRRY